MCYRCQVCRGIVPHGTPQRRYSILRRKGPLTGTIERELAVCQDCWHNLEMRPTTRSPEQHQVVPAIPAQAQGKTTRSEPDVVSIKGAATVLSHKRGLQDVIVNTTNDGGKPGNQRR